MGLLHKQQRSLRQRYLKARLQLAHLPYVKTFEQFDFSFQPSLDERQIRELRTHCASFPLPITVAGLATPSEYW
jgi:DNA replication protein DnaC